MYSERRSVERYFEKYTGYFCPVNDIYRLLHNVKDLESSSFYSAGAIAIFSLRFLIFIVSGGD
jgi:hypothetical protein